MKENLQAKAKAKFIEIYPNRSFLKEFGKNYLKVEEKEDEK